MLSLRERCIRLREIAEYLEDNERTQHMALELRDAADTIWELRCRLVDQREEVELLKEQVCWLKKGDVLHVLTDQELADQQKHKRETQASIDALEDENTKLRKLVLKNWYIALSEREVLRAYDIDPYGDIYMAALDAAIAIAKDRMRELKIEVK